MKTLSLGDRCDLDERQMTHGVIPVQQSALPGLIKLPRRYEQDSVNVPLYSNHLRLSEPSSPLPENGNLSERLSDLMLATLWIKQQLILLRQHDILLKRQFFNIHHSITSMQPNRNATQLNPSSPWQPSNFTANVDLTEQIKLTDTDPLDLRGLTNQADHEVLRTLSTRPITKLGSHLETLLVRPVPYSNDCSDYSDDDSDEGDVFFESKYYRPRSTSMRTSRDLAASARRRGSKDLI